jgi:predicted kinase
MQTARGAGSPALFAVGGWMASGKSSLAEALARRIGAKLISADAVRRELHDAGREEAYLPGFSSRLYPVVLRRAEEALHAGAPVVVDATFRSRAMRASARSLAGRLGVPFCFVECRADAETCRGRLRTRERGSGDAGWLEMFDAFLSLWESPDELPPEAHLSVATDGPLEASLAAVLAALRKRRLLPAGDVDPPGHPGDTG